jgi:hypothetical protein
MATYSGQTIVTTSGTAVSLGSSIVNGPLTIKAHASNTDLIAVGNVNEDVTVSNGFLLSPGDIVILDWVGNLSSILIDSAVNGEGVSWIFNLI